MKARVWLLALPLAAMAAPPVANLVVEVREVAVAAPPPFDPRGGFTVSTAPAPAGTQRIAVANGATAVLHLPQWTATTTGEWVVGGTASAPSGAGRTQRWVDAGRGFSVHPRWPGGRAPVTVEIAVESGEGPAARTRLVVPQDEWTPFARSGAQEWQLRVSVAR